jgi:putative membrane protein
MTRVSKLFPESEKNRLRQLIQQIEAKTQGEIVPVVVARSDAYVGATWRVAVSLMFFGALMVTWMFPDLHSLAVLGISFGFLMVGMGLGRISWVERMALHPDEMAEEAHQRALQMFFQLNIHGTPHRSGVLIFVSLMEHYVEIVADTGIHQRVGESFWTPIVNSLSSQIRAGQLAAGLGQAIESVGKQFTPHFSSDAPTPKTLKNDLILIEN